MDPVTHLAIPLLVLLVARQNPRLVIPLSLLAIFPDFDSIVGPHRMVLHNVFVIFLIPLAFILFARLKRPELLLPGMIALFFLSSHLLLDLDGVAFFYPLDATAYQFVPVLEFTTAPNMNLVFYVDWGAVQLPQKAEYNMLPGISVAYLLFFSLLCYQYRKQVKRFTGRVAGALGSLFAKIAKMVRGERPS